MALTRSNILTAVQYDKRINTALDTVKFNEWMNDFDEMVYELKNSTNPVQNSSSLDYSISTNSQEITLPLDFRDMNKSWLGLFLLDGGSRISKKLYEIPERDAGKTTGFSWITNSTIGISGIAGSVIRIIYIPEITRATTYTGAETLLIEDRFREFAVSYVKTRYFNDINEIEYLQMDTAFLADREEEFRRGLIKSPKTIVIPQISNIYS